jgi:flagellar biosynthesis/type III secretory pathway protein FliH
MQTGTRWGGKANPRDLTKTRQLELLRQKTEREQAVHIDVEAIRRQAYAEGYERGHAEAFEEAFTKGWDALAQHLVSEGVLDADEPSGNE